MTDETAYTALNDDLDDHRWAYGTGFDEPLSGVDTMLAHDEIPDGVDGADLAAYCLMLGDDALILSQRLQDWVTRLPELEEETALANIALDLLGQARLLLSRAGSADGTGRGEDDFAFARAPEEFRHVGLVAEADEDFGRLIARLTVFTIWRLALFGRLRESRDPVLAAIAEKGAKELRYHLEYAGQWLIRLGDGTDLSHQRAQHGLDVVAPYLGELFIATEVERRLADAAVAVPPASMLDEFDTDLDRIAGEATLTRPTTEVAGSNRRGRPSPAAVALIERMQSVARALPGATW